MKRIILAFFGSAVCVVALASVLVHPSGPVKAVRSSKPLLAGADVDPQVLALLEKSCQNCHSENTEWPFYSYIAPMSWLVESDVAQARNHMNLSHWDEYSVEQKQEILGRIGAVARSGEMPPARYTAIHTNAKLSPAERDQLYAWSHLERHRLKTVTPSPMGAGL
ncbi:MAG: heme-binding domain-containing protein [Bryobacteraceae bacterium]